MKKIISLVLIALIVLSSLALLSSCSKKDITKELKFELMENDTYKVVGFEGEETEIEIPATYDGKPVTVIGGTAFENSALVKVTLPDTITAIEYNAFRCSEALEEINIKEGVTSIGVSAFYGCGSLKKITLPQTLTHIGNMAFQACTKLESINIPEGVNKKYIEMFMGCVSLKTVTVDSGYIAGVSNIEDMGYLYKHATTIYVKDTVSAVGKYITDNYVAVESDLNGYVKYTPKVED